MHKSCAWCLGIVLVATAVQAAEPDNKPRPFDWPQWQGPERNSYCKETGLLSTWPENGPPLAWKAKGLGIGYSGPAVSAGRIFGMGSHSDDEFVWALDEANGKELWSVGIADKLAKVSSNGDGPRCTPTVDGDKLYVLGVGGDLVCIKVADGAILWRKNLKKDFNGKMMSSWGFSESLLVDGDKLICTPGSDEAALVALNKKTGEVIWKAAVPSAGGAGYSSVVIAEVGGVRQYIQFLGKSKGLIGVRAKDGKFLWNYTKIANGTANIPTPIIRGDLVLCTTGYRDGGTALLRLAPDGDGTKVEEVYQHPGTVFQNTHGGLVIVGDHIYGGHGHNQGAPICVELMTGKIVWKERGAGGGSAAILYADGNLYMRFDDGTMALVEASPKGYNLKAKFKLPDKSNARSWPHPVIANGKLYIRDQDTLLCFDVKQK